MSIERPDTERAAARDRSTSRVAVVTGGTAGVGRATVRRLAAEGFDVAILARGQDGLDATRAEVERAGRRALAIHVDVAESQDVLSAAARIERELGPIDVWVNNAMVSIFAPFEEINPYEFDRVTRVTYLGVVNGTRAALACMRPRDRGTIVQVGSALAYRSIPLQSAYCGSKAAIRAFTDSLRCELRHARSGIRLTMVQLPAVNTPQFGWVRSRLPHEAQPVPPIFQPEVPARAIVWAALHPRRELYVGWSTIKAIVFGAKLFPSVGDAYLARHGFDDQQTAAPRDRAAPDNLFEPVAGDHGAHGAFDGRAKPRSIELRASLARRAIGAMVAAAAGVGVIAFVASRFA
jgi:NAD(P)-dependent dehydrogenase (short-subunit alcohol dehydrogenase family)